MHLGSITQDTLNLMKSSLGNGFGIDPRTGQPLAKGVTVSTGLVAYDLQAPAKNLYPVITPIRNAIPRVKRGSPGRGDAAHWKVVSAITGSGYNAMGWVPEGQRSGTMSYTTEDKSATYVTIGEEDYLTFEAESAAEGFEDENAMVTFRLLQKMMQKEEMGLLGGNRSVALGTPATPTTEATGTGGTLPAATYSVIVVALTFEGYKNSSLAAGVATKKTVAGADGATFEIKGGSSNKSAAKTQAITLGQKLVCTVTPIFGAVAYAWYVGTAGNEKLEAITTVPTVTFSAPLAGTGQPATAITEDNSRNTSLAFDGLIYQAVASGTAYHNNLGGGTLTASGRGSISEIDTMFKLMWDTYRIGPTVLYVNSQEQKSITDKVLSTGSAPLLRFDSPGAQGQPYVMMAGGTIEYYYNPFTPGGGYKVPVRLHPDVPPGMIVGYCEQLPAWYQSNEVPNVAEVLLRRDYYRIDWPLRTRKREYGVYAEEVLAVYAPFGIGIIDNIAP